MQRSREPRFAPYGVYHAPPVFSSRLIYVNARMNSFRRDLTERTQKNFDAKDTLTSMTSYSTAGWPC
jgi:hypothetical protein